MYYVELNEDFLSHHGILGMKWGKQNGPPYPLKPSMKSYAEKKAAKARLKSAKSEYKSASKLYKKQRRAEKNEEKIMNKLEKDMRKEDEFKTKKEAIIKSGNIKEVAKYVDMMTNQEINETITRYTTEKRLKDLVAESTPKKKSAMDYVEAFSKKTKTMSDLVGNGAKLANNINKLTKAMNGEVLNDDKKD